MQEKLYFAGTLEAENTIERHEVTKGERHRARHFECVLGIVEGKAFGNDISECIRTSSACDTKKEKKSSLDGSEVQHHALGTGTGTRQRYPPIEERPRAQGIVRAKISILICIPSPIRFSAFVLAQTPAPNLVQNLCEMRLLKRHCAHAVATTRCHALKRADHSIRTTM